MRIAILATLMAAASLSAHATGTVHIGYDPTGPSSNFGAPTATSADTAYDITTSQTATTFTVDVKMSGGDGAALGNYTNLYFGAVVPADGKIHSLVGFEVENNDVFNPNSGVKAYGINGFGAVVTNSGSTEGHDAEISFTLPFAFLETDPLAVGAPKAGPGSTFYLTLSQTFGNSVQGGVANFGADDLGKFTIPTAVPEPSAPALLALGAVVLGLAARRRRAAAKA